MTHAAPNNSKWDDELCLRWETWHDDVMRPLQQLYGERDDFHQWVNRLLDIVADGYAERSAELRTLDQQRLLQPDWFQTSDQIGYICYADRFAQTLNGVREQIPYLKELGVTYLHLMPLLKPRAGESDGGYAVADYRQIDARLGSMADLRELSAECRRNSVSLCIDLVCNHTAAEHTWAQRALAGEKKYQDYYLMFDDRTLPDQYEPTLREIFPDVKRGNFIYEDTLKKWIWSTFNPYQWDLNYANPAVLSEMLGVMLYLANQGVEVLRMDAVAFMWKQVGTTCENLPEAHAILQALRALTRLAAPALVLKAEAIVAPKDVVPYFGTEAATGKECEIAYNNSLMVLLWSALAERNVRLMTHSLQQMPAIPSNTAWANYVRCHDDIGWAIVDEDAAAVGLDGYWHRAFLSDFYSGQFAGSFARGQVFQHNPINNDRRISGAAASLAGLEVAVEQGDSAEIQLAINRLLLIHSMILSYGGIPLLYMGDEIGLFNDYGYVDVAAHAHDNRWLNRPKMDWQKASERHTAGTIAQQLFSGLQQMIGARKSLAALHTQATATPVWLHNDQTFGFLRHSQRGRVLVIGNFSEKEQMVSAERLQSLDYNATVYDHLSGQTFDASQPLKLTPFQSLWLT